MKLKKKKLEQSYKLKVAKIYKKVSKSKLRVKSNKRLANKIKNLARS